MFGPSVSREEAEPSTLSVPSTDKNFLISPPGSPPVGWEPIREDPPNTDTLAEDLMRALGELRETQSHLESHEPEAWVEGGVSISEPEVIIAPSAGGSDVPGVTVQAMDPEPAQAGAAGSKTHLGYTISSVKATVESMRGPIHVPNGDGGGKRITPTGRPPLA